MTDSTNVSSLNMLDSLFPTISSQNKIKENTETININKELENTFSSSSNINTSTNHHEPMTNEKIMALFHTSQISSPITSGVNMPSLRMQSSNCMYPKR